MTSRRWLAALFLGSTLWPVAVHGQTVAPERGGFTTSMGIPHRWRFNAGALAGVHRDGELNEATFFATVGAYRDLINPAIQAAGFLGELYGGRRGDFNQFSEGWDGGIRMGLFMPVTRLAFSADYSIADDRVDFLLSLIHPLKRGGILVDGGNLRVDYLPGRHNSLYFGIQLPVGQKFIGKTRPQQDRVRLPEAPRPEFAVQPTQAALDATARGKDLAIWISRVTVPYMDQFEQDQDRSMERFVGDMQELAAFLQNGAAAGIPGPVTPAQLVNAYHAVWEHAFSLAVSDGVADGSTPLGVEVWDHAREALLDNVIFPFNRLLGLKKHNGNTWGFGAEASAAFYEWLSTEAPVPEARLRDTAWVFGELLATIESVRAYQRDRWDDGRFVFLPLQLAVREDEHDEQAEIDALLERAVEERLQGPNDIYYVENEQFQVETRRMILAAKDHHVLWIHDYTGRTANGPDLVAFSQTVDSYLRALINAVNAYDDTGKMPQYIIVLDQWYFQAKGGALYLKLLQDPLHYEFRVGAGSRDLEDRVRAAQEELRAAVAGSALLQAQSRMFDEGWIENMVKVHVNITNPADVSFWTDEILPLMGLPDMIARDHRKISFYDILEEDPYSGGAMFTGMGVGEEYTGARWEDRALMIIGPAILRLKYAARDLLLSQGLEETEIPWSLRPRPLAADYADRIAARTTTVAPGVTRSRAFGVNNQVGYQPKMVDVLKATLYTLMPSGSLIYGPDSLWNLPLWGSMMLGNALRGGHSLIVAPAIAHAPSGGFPQMSRAQELLARGVVLPEIFRAYFDRTGGLLRVGLYNPPGGAGDTPSKMKALVETLSRTTWLRDLFGIPPSTLQAIDERADALTAAGFNRTYWVQLEDSLPRLHLKTHFYATPEAWNGLLSTPEARDFLLTYYQASAELNQLLADGQFPAISQLTDAIIPPGTATARRQIDAASVAQRQRMGLYFLAGSHNQNYRSFIMDGEVAYVVSSWQALHALPDFITLAGQSVWIENIAEFEQLFPRYEGLQRRLGRWMRISV